MKSMMSKERGEVSLFVVVFATLLLTIVTVSFVRIMIHDQQQASTIDLSQSAYDSAQAGVEDAKLALLRCKSGGDCSKINSTTCNDAVGSPGEEVKVEQSDSSSLNQAYTCLLINTQTDNVQGNLTQDASGILPLIGLSAFNTIKIDWFKGNDASDIPTFSNGTPLLSQNTWPVNRPPIIRAQLIQYNSTGFSLSDFDGNNSTNATNNTLFLYPTDITVNTAQFNSDARKLNKSIQQVICNKTNIYSCSTTIKLPKAVSGNDNPAYLRLTSLYGASDYQITLKDVDGKDVKFNGVQPSIDSTGRAGDLFRRVQARVEFNNTDFPYPEAAVDISGSLCKNFEVTATTYSPLTPMCTP